VHASAWSSPSTSQTLTTERTLPLTQSRLSPVGPRQLAWRTRHLSPPCLLRLLPAGAFAGWSLHPLERAPPGHRAQPLQTRRQPSLTCPARVTAAARRIRGHQVSEKR
jgi:hypothetical protein